MANFAVSVHGTSFHVEDLSRIDRVTRRGWGLEVASYRHGGYAGPAAWVHAPIPLSAPWELEGLPIGGHIRWVELRDRVLLKGVQIDFDSADQELYISNVHVHDGGNLADQRDGLHERGPAFSWDFDPALEVSSGLNLAIGVEFPTVIDGTAPPPPALVFNAAFAFYYTEPTL